MIENIKRTIKANLTAIGFKLLFGLILASVIAFATISLLVEFSMYFEPSRAANGLAMQYYLAIGIISGILLWLLFYSPAPDKEEKVETPISFDFASFSYKAIIGYFVMGFVEGMVRRNRMRRELGLDQRPSAPVRRKIHSV